MTKNYLRYESIFSLNKNGYDPFIDFLKGLCIVFVILNHCMPLKAMSYSAFFFWGTSAVPIFLILQVFHAYKKGVNDLKINYKRIGRKILWPFILCELIIFIVFIIKGEHTSPTEIANELMMIVKSGGYGPGAYYPWIYIQFAILLPLVAPIFKIPIGKLCVFFIIISQFIESTFAFFNVSQLLYRLLFLRYCFIVLLGYILVQKGFILNKYTFSLATACLLFSSVIVYSEHDFSPLIYPFVNPVCHWFCYIYIAYILLFLLRYLYRNIPENSTIMSFFLITGKYSYEIFLFQIVYFATSNDYISETIAPFVSNSLLRDTLMTIFPVLFCTLSVVAYKKLKFKYQERAL